MKEKKNISILVTGAGGQLGQELSIASKSFLQFRYQFADRSVLDISDKDALKDFFEKKQPDVVINCAAYTNVEKAEDEPHQAILYNATSVGYLADLCEEHNVMLIHFSTDYVFDGEKKSPYTEEDSVNPLSAYAMSKLEGEKIILQKMIRYFILRVSWLYSPFGNNFYKTMIRLAKERGELRVVNDQVASPTFAGHLAMDILKLVETIFIDKKSIQHGLYHYEQTGEASWFDFASKIVELKKLNVPVHPVSTGEFPMKAARPAYSKMNGSLFTSNTGIAARTWQNGLAACISQDEQTN